MKTVAIVQARMGSSRLPGKVMLDLGGESVLSRVVERVRRAKLVQEVIVATTSHPADQNIVGECGRLAVHCFRGSESDVLDRYYWAATEASADTIIRITADCPLVDPFLIDKTIARLSDAGADYASNVLPRTYPRGLDVEAMTSSALAQTWRDAREPHQREHVTPYIYQQPEKFRLAALTGKIDYSSYRWTLDTPEDLQMLKMLYARLQNRDDFGWEDAMAIVQKEPRLAEINAGVVQKTIPSI